MEREIKVRAVMVLTILVLAALILITPGLLGRPSELSSLPVLIIGLTKQGQEFIVDVEGAVQAYFYDRIGLEVSSLPDGSSVASLQEDEIYSLYLRLPANETGAYLVHAFLLDQLGNYFEYNVTMWASRDLENRTLLSVSLIDEDSPQTIRVSPPADFRWVIPRRGEM